MPSCRIASADVFVQKEFQPGGASPIGIESDLSRTRKMMILYCIIVHYCYLLMYVNVNVIIIFTVVVIVTGYHYC